MNFGPEELIMTAFLILAALWLPQIAALRIASKTRAEIREIRAFLEGQRKAA